ncbi:hypothetical protein NPIL_633631, partial [Nephila pilipes]
DSENLEPVRRASDAVTDRPTIDDMIERLQQEQLHQVDDGENSENASPRASVDFMQSPQSSRRSVSGNEERNAAEPFSPRTPRSQASM